MNPRNQLEEIRLRYQLAQRRFHQSIGPSAQRQAEVSALQALASWALRSGLSGWAIVRDGRLTVSNRMFDAFDRSSAIGPGWTALRHEDAAREANGHGRSLAEVVIDESGQLLTGPGLTRRGRWSRGAQIIEVTVERALISAPESLSVLVNVREVTEFARSEARLGALQDRLRERDTAARVGEVALEIGHDLGNLVGALNARLMVLEAEGRLGGEELEALKNIAHAQSALIARLRSVAQPVEEHAEPLHLLDDVVRPAVQIVESSLAHRNPRQAVWVRVDPDIGELPLVTGMRDALVNVVINLIINARDAMPGGGLVRIRGTADDDAVVLLVEDQGSGIPQETLPRIFDAFFSTKGAGRGMGLSMARQLLRRHGGNLLAQNLPGGGARFELRFPPLRKQKTPGPPSPAK